MSALSFGTRQRLKIGWKMGTKFCRYKAYIFAIINIYDKHERLFGLIYEYEQKNQRFLR